MEQVYTPKQNYKVLVNCMTYNQSKYIEDALNGFAMQKTDFPFACLVMDDASTDGEQEVIKAWMERECDVAKAENVEIEKSFITLVPHKTNSSCTFAFYFLKENLYKKGGKMPMIAPWREHCEYEALCEGDDYWINENKLQTQIVFLDNNPEYTMCFHNAVVHWEDASEEDHLMSNLSESDYNGVEIYRKWIVPTASVVLRSKVRDSELYKKVTSNKKFVFGDTPLFVTCAELGKVRGFANSMSIYRRVAGSATYRQSDNYDKIKARSYHYLEFRNVFGPRYKKEAEMDFIADGLYCFTHSIRSHKDKIQWWGLVIPLKTNIWWTLICSLEMAIAHMRREKKTL